MNAEAQSDPAYHVAIKRTVRAGKEREFENALRDFAHRSLSFPGTTGVHVIQPSAESVSREYGILRSFMSRADADSFYASPMFSNFIDQTRALVESDGTRRELHGLECFFRDVQAAPPKWRMALVTWLGVFPTVLLWVSVVELLLADSGLVVGVAVATALSVATLTWVVMPRLVRWFHRWLHGPGRA